MPLLSAASQSASGATGGRLRRRRNAFSAAKQAACSSAAGSSNRYPEAVRSNFMTACVASSGDRPGCQCALDRMQSEYSLDEFIEIDRLAWSGYMAPKIQQVFVDCSS